MSKIVESITTNHKILIKNIEQFIKANSSIYLFFLQQNDILANFNENLLKFLNNKFLLNCVLNESFKTFVSFENLIKHDKVDENINCRNKKDR